MTLRKLTDFGAGDARHKLLPFHQTSVKTAQEAGNSNPDVAGEIEGYAAGLLNIDRGSDIIFPGAFNEKLQDFRDNGVVCYQHDWTAVIGKPLSVEEKGEPEYALASKSQIINTTLGSDVMKLVRTGTLKTQSIGYRLMQGGYSVLNRETLEATLKERSINPLKISEILSDFDKRKLSEVFGLFNIELFEYSVVTRPMNPNATITSAKGEGAGENLDNLLDGLPFSYHPLIVLAAVKGYAKRVNESKTLYSEKGRNIGRAHIEAVKETREALELLLPELKDIEAQVVEEKADETEINRILGELLVTESRINGVSLS